MLTVLAVSVPKWLTLAFVLYILLKFPMHSPWPRFCRGCMDSLSFPALVLQIASRDLTGHSKLWAIFVVSNQYRCTTLICDAQRQQDKHPITIHWCMRHVTTGCFQMRYEESGERWSAPYFRCTSRTPIEASALECVFYKNVSGWWGRESTVGHLRWERRPWIHPYIRNTSSCRPTVWFEHRYVHNVALWYHTTRYVDGDYRQCMVYTAVDGSWR